MTIIHIDPMHRSEAIRSWLVTHIGDSFVNVNVAGDYPMRLARHKWSISWDYDTDLYWIVHIEDDELATAFRLTFL